MMAITIKLELLIRIEKKIISHVLPSLVLLSSFSVRKIHQIEAADMLYHRLLSFVSIFYWSKDDDPMYMEIKIMAGH